MSPRHDKAVPGWPYQNANAPLEVEAEVFRNGEFALRIVVSGEDRPGMSRDDCQRIAGMVAERVGPMLVGLMRAHGLDSATWQGSP